MYFQILLLLALVLASLPFTQGYESVVPFAEQAIATVDVPKVNGTSTQGPKFDCSSNTSCCRHRLCCGITFPENNKYNFGEVAYTESFKQNVSLDAVKCFIEKKMYRINYFFDRETPNMKHYFEDTALMASSSKGNLPVVKFLVENGAAVNMFNRHLVTPLFYAAQNNYVEVVKYLLKSGADVYFEEIYGRTPLFIACQNGHIDVVMALIEHGVNPYSRNRQGHNAEDYCSPLIIDFLKLKNVEKIERFDKYYDSIFIDKVYYDITFKSAQSPLKHAVESGDINVVSKILETRMFNISEKFDNNENVLFNAIQKCDFNMVRFLISNGANVNDGNNKLQTPLMKAVINKCDTAFVSMLVENGANTKIRDHDDMTALIYAAGNSQKMFELFIALNPNSYYDDYGEIKNSLFMAVQNGVFDVAQLLLKKGGCINSKNSDGQTLLIVAIKSGSLGMVKFLVDNGTNINGRNNRGYTALSYSNCYFCAEFNTAITQYLKSFGAK